MDQLLAMRVFEQVVDKNGFAAAARALDMSPPVVTRLVAELEDELGVRLLHRTTRSLSLTEVGELYLARVRQVLDAVDEAKEQVAGYNDRLHGVLRISSDAALARSIVAPSIAGFREQHPEVRFEVTIRSGQSLAIEDFDITLIGSTVGADLSVVARRIFQLDAILVASPDYIERRGLPTSVQALAEHDCVYTRRDSEPFRGWTLWQKGAPETATNVEFEPVLISNHTDTLLQAVVSGCGIASMGMNIALPLIRDGRLVRVLAPWITAELVAYAGLPSRQFIPRRVELFLDHLIEFTRTHEGDNVGRA